MIAAGSELQAARRGLPARQGASPGAEPLANDDDASNRAGARGHDDVGFRYDHRMRMDDVDSVMVMAGRDTEAHRDQKHRAENLLH